MREKWGEEAAVKETNESRLNSAADCISAAAESGSSSMMETLLSRETVEQLEPLEKVQLTEALRICAASRTMADAGRRLFATGGAARETKTINYSDRMRKYLSRYGIGWEQIHQRL